LEQTNCNIVVCSPKHRQRFERIAKLGKRSLQLLFVDENDAKLLCLFDDKENNDDTLSGLLQSHCIECDCNINNIVEQQQQQQQSKGLECND
jgi:hypothetical protein